MVLSVNAVFNAAAEMADSANYPHVRLATFAPTFAASAQFDAPPWPEYSWARAGPDAMYPLMEEGSPFKFYKKWFSAACFFFGRDLHVSLGGAVPIGLVAAAAKGQRIECWLSAVPNLICKSFYYMFISSNDFDIDKHFSQESH